MNKGLPVAQHERKGIILKEELDISQKMSVPLHFRWLYSVLLSA